MFEKTCRCAFFVVTLIYKVLFMQEQNQSLQTLEDIKQLMTKSSRFISLSGWSGIAAGTCALVAAWVARQKINTYADENNPDYQNLSLQLIYLAILTFLAAFILAFLFTYLRSRKTGVPIWGYTSRKLMLNVAIPMVVGGLLIWRLVDFQQYGLIAPACLLFYGLALVNASKYTLPEIRYLGFLQLLLGLFNLWSIGYGLYFWAVGFGILHILYGIVMWNKYERNQQSA
jgi:hypothetical protein